MAANWVKIHPSATSSTIITKKPAITPSVPCLFYTSSCV